MRNVWMLLLTLTISTFWIHVPHKGKIGFLLNPAVKLSYNQYVWLLCQHLIYITMAAVISDLAKDSKYRGIFKGFLWVVIADGIVWVAAYDDPLKRYRITWNIIKTVIFIGVIAYEKWLNNKGRISNQG